MLTPATLNLRKQLSHPVKSDLTAWSSDVPWLLMCFWVWSHDLGFEDFVGVEVLVKILSPWVVGGERL